MSIRPIDQTRMSARVRIGCLLGVLVSLFAGCRTVPPVIEDEASEPISGARYEIEPIGEVMRFMGPEDLGALTHVDGDLYYGLADSGGILATLDIGIDPQSGRVTRFRCVSTNALDGVADGEGVAYDRFSKRVWVADECKNTIREYGPADGVRCREVALPVFVGRCRANLGLESLAISSDGLTLWTCNEEAMEGDGERSTAKAGSMVRLMRFRRKTPAANWTFAGSWAYRTGRLHGGAYRGMIACGVSDLCVLDDGSLLVLEREFSKSVYPRFRCRIYQVDFTGATDVSGMASLEGAEYVPVKKRRIFVENTGRANYEGIALGPVLTDGSRSLLLVSDGDGPAVESIYALRLKAGKLGE